MKTLNFGAIKEGEFFEWRDMMYKRVKRQTIIWPHGGKITWNAIGQRYGEIRFFQDSAKIKKVK